ncbi:hypothetical protein Poly30_22930 [Planctomycetes bacterium Poly30]|uniref:PatA-like N-terminal domain-containing protein n=1 Tax=Saltatorellus ferox TaxID=2528018 RepID=A0A518ERQ0_9BACT|nr:hypothetical protein Poly30_22930 [Planctomycetes bacterium Poly30]
MQDPEAKEIIELLSRVADIKTRLRQLESIRSVAETGGMAPPDRPAQGSLLRAKNHLELALEALGTPTWGFASTPASSLKITGFYSSDIYKALKDIRSRTRGEGETESAAQSTQDDATTTSANGNRRGAPSAGRRKSDRVSHHWSQKSKARRKKADAQRESQADPAEEEHLQESGSQHAVARRSTLASASDSKAQGGRSDEEGGSSVWVQHRVDEIQRALTAAFGDDEILPDLETAPKPFAAPEFIGNTDALSIPELIGFFQLQGKTGVLTIDARHEQFTLEYLRGELIHAGSSSSPDGHRLGEVLVKLGHLTESKLERLLAGKSDAERLGDALRRGEVVGEDALAQALQYQIQNIFYRLFDLGGCRFTFREGLEGEPRARVRYNVTRLLLETARHRDELEGSAERRAG